MSKPITVIYLNDDEAKMVIAMLQNTITDYELKDLAGKGSYNGMLKAMRQVRETIKEQAERKELLV